MIAASPTTVDLWMFFSIFVLLLVLILLSVAEMGLSRVSKPKAHALADSGAKGGQALLRYSIPTARHFPLLVSLHCWSRFRHFGQSHEASSG